MNPISLIKQYEGYKSCAYKDCAGVWTCGYGSTGCDVYEDTVWTQDYAESRLATHIKQLESYLNTLITVRLTDNQRTALLSLIYNIGIGAFSKSTLRKYINAEKDKDSIKEQWMRWNKAGGKVVNGLTARRVKEWEVYDGE